MFGDRADEPFAAARDHQVDQPFERYEVRDVGAIGRRDQLDRGLREACGRCGPVECGADRRVAGDDLLPAGDRRGQALDPHRRLLPPALGVREARRDRFDATAASNIGSNQVLISPETTSTGAANSMICPTAGSDGMLRPCGHSVLAQPDTATKAATAKAGLSFPVKSRSPSYCRHILNNS